MHVIIPDLTGPRGCGCQCCSPDKGSSVTCVCTIPFLIYFCTAKTVILHFLYKKTCGRQHMQWTLIKMHVRLLLSQHPQWGPGLEAWYYSITCKLVFDGKQYDNCPRKNCLHEKMWWTLTSVSPFPTFSSRGEPQWVFEILHRAAHPQGHHFPSHPMWAGASAFLLWLHYAVNKQQSFLRYCNLSSCTFPWSRWSPLPLTQDNATKKSG